MAQAYYNENDPFAAAWLRELIAAGAIAPGHVDERDIRDVRPSDLEGFTQCHFFAGIGVWSYALRQAGWPDDRPVWTGSCPCQPFSAAGRQSGFADERHLWPSFHWLISECRPAAVLGEQVASKAAEPWLDLVQADLEALGYAVGAVAFPAAGVGAPHIRDRAYWVGHADHAGLAQRERDGRIQQEAMGPPAREAAISNGNPGQLADKPRYREIGGRLVRVGNAASTRSLPGALPGVHCGEEGAGPWHGEPERSGAGGRLADAADQRRERRRASEAGDGRDAARLEPERLCTADQGRPGPTNGHWRAVDWLLCRDGKWRPVRPGSFPLADGPAARVGRLRGYGNAINAQAAQAFIEAVM